MTKSNRSSDTYQQPPGSGFCQLLAECGLPHVQGMELLGLVKMCAGAYDRILSERMRDEHISPPQWRILLRLYLAEGSGQGALSPTDLAHSQCLSKNTISTHLRALEESQFIERRLDVDDLRAFRIQLTTSGRRLVRTSTPRQIAFLNQLASQLSAQECDTLQVLLVKLHESLQRKQEVRSGM